MDYSGVAHEDQGSQGSSTVNKFGKAGAILGPCRVMFRLPATHTKDACQRANSCPDYLTLSLNPSSVVFFLQGAGQARISHM